MYACMYMYGCICARVYFAVEESFKSFDHLHYLINLYLTSSCNLFHFEARRSPGNNIAIMEQLTIENSDIISAWLVLAQVVMHMLLNSCTIRQLFSLVFIYPLLQLYLL